MQGKINKRSFYFLACLRNQRSHTRRILASLLKVPRNTYKCGLVNLWSRVGNRQSVAPILPSDFPEYWKNIHKLCRFESNPKQYFAKNVSMDKIKFRQGTDCLHIRSAASVLWNMHDTNTLRFENKRPTFPLAFHESIYCSWILKIVDDCFGQSPVGNTSAMVLVMAWCQTGNRTEHYLNQVWLTRFMHTWFTIGLNLFNEYC